MALVEAKLRFLLSRIFIENKITWKRGINILAFKAIIQPFVCSELKRKQKGDRRGWLRNKK